MAQKRRQKGEGSVYHRIDRNQWVAVADLGQKGGKRDRREFTGSTPEAAMEKRRQFLHRHDDGFTLPRGRQPSVSEWVLYWCHHTAKSRLDPGGWGTYRRNCEDHIAPYFESVKLAQLTVEDIEDWHAELLRKPKLRGDGTLSASSVALAHGILSTCLNDAVRRKRMSFNPCSITPPPHSEAPAIEPPTADEVDLVISSCQGRPGGARWILAITTGLRQGEVLGLRWRDLRLADPASVTVRKQQARISGEWVYKEPKSRKSRRQVPLPGVAVAALKAHREGLEVADIGGLVFTRPSGEPIHRRQDWRDWTVLLEDTGLPHYRVHDLRHAYATELLEQGEDPRVVQELLGWSTAAMAQVYQHVRPATHARVVASLDKRFGG